MQSCVSSPICVCCVCWQQVKLSAARKGLSAAKSELDRLHKENTALEDARGVAVSRRDAILAKVSACPCVCEALFVTVTFACCDDRSVMKSAASMHPPLTRCQPHIHGCRSVWKAIIHVCAVRWHTPRSPHLCNTYGLLSISIPRSCGCSRALEALQLLKHVNTTTLARQKHSCYMLRSMRLPKVANHFVGRSSASNRSTSGPNSAYNSSKAV